MKQIIHFLLLIVTCSPNIGCQQVPEIEFTLSNGNCQSAMLQKYCKLGNDELLTLGKSGIYEGQVRNNGIDTIYVGLNAAICDSVLVVDYTNKKSYDRDGNRTIPNYIKEAGRILSLVPIYPKHSTCILFITESKPEAAKNTYQFLASKNNYPLKTFVNLYITVQDTLATPLWEMAH